MKEWIQHEGRGQEHITIICPHLDSLLYKQPFDQHKCKIFDNHSVIIDIEGHTILASSKLLQHIEKQSQPAEPTIPLELQTTHTIHS
jgi:hypothetical protein